MKHSIVLKFNNVEMLKTMWKMLKTPAAGICAKCQNRLRRPRQFAQRNKNQLTNEKKALYLRQSRETAQRHVKNLENRIAEVNHESNLVHKSRRKKIRQTLQNERIPM